MSDFEDKLNSLLNDPDQMSRIADMAKSFMGGETGERNKTADSDSGGIDPGLISRISKLLSRSGSGDGERTALLNAMKPYLSEKRRSKMDKAMKLAKFAEIAELAADEFGGDDDV